MTNPDVCAELDDEFIRLMRQIESFIGGLSKHVKIRVESWARRLCEVYANETFQRNRNAYAYLLLQCVKADRWYPPLHKYPPSSGPLPLLPVSDLIQIKKGKFEVSDKAPFTTSTKAVAVDPKKRLEKEVERLTSENRRLRLEVRKGLIREKKLCERLRCREEAMLMANPLALDLDTDSTNQGGKKQNKDKDRDNGDALYMAQLLNQFQTSSSSSIQSLRSSQDQMDLQYAMPGTSDHDQMKLIHSTSNFFSRRGSAKRLNEIDEEGNEKVLKVEEEQSPSPTTSSQGLSPISPTTQSARTRSMEMRLRPSPSNTLNVDEGDEHSFDTPQFFARRADSGSMGASAAVERNSGNENESDISHIRREDNAEHGITGKHFSFGPREGRTSQRQRESQVYFDTPGKAISPRSREKNEAEDSAMSSKGRRTSTSSDENDNEGSPSRRGGRIEKPTSKTTLEYISEDGEDRRMDNKESHGERRREGAAKVHPLSPFSKPTGPGPVGKAASPKPGRKPLLEDNQKQKNQGVERPAVLDNPPSPSNTREFFSYLDEFSAWTNKLLEAEDGIKTEKMKAGSSKARE